MARMRPESFPDPRRASLLAAIFTGDLTRAAATAFDVLGHDRVRERAGDLDLERFTLPITVPVDEHGVVVLSTGHVDAPRRPATLDLARPVAPPGRRDYQAAFALARLEPEPLRIPGIADTAAAGRPLAALASLTVAVAPGGLAVVGFGPEGEVMATDLGEDTARLLATALLITVGVKLAKAEMGRT